MVCFNKQSAMICCSGDGRLTVLSGWHRRVDVCVPTCTGVKWEPTWNAAHLSLRDRYVCLSSPHKYSVFACAPISCCVCGSTAHSLKAQDLQSAGPRLISHPHSKAHFADGSFAVAGPAAWNSLPTHIRNIHTHAAVCRHLKTYLLSSPGWLSLTTTTTMTLLYCKALLSTG